VEEYELEKWIWTEADFDVMGWHDSSIHALAFCSWQPGDLTNRELRYIDMGLNGSRTEW
jgi:hypothetical protein